MNVYEVITKRIVEQLEQGTVPWRKPWRGGIDGMPKNLKSGKAYRGINVFMLASLGYESPHWLTFKQAKALGGSVRKGEKACPVIFWNWREKTAGNGEKQRSAFVRYYRVFNASQCDGIEVPAAETLGPPVDELTACETVLADMPNAPRIERGAPRAYYTPANDLVHLPERGYFDTPEAYYATAFHELAHSTGHDSRLARSGVTDPIQFGSHAYSKEELVAEMGAAFLCGHTGIEAVTLENSAAYIDGWLQKLHGDARLVINAAAQAQRAVDHILNREVELMEAVAEAA